MARPPADDVVCVVGAGYVGLVTGICLADSGRTVHLVEIEPRRLERLAAGGCPIHEPGLEEMLQRLQAAGRVQVTGDIAVGVRDAGLASSVSTDRPDARGDDRSVVERPQEFFPATGAVGQFSQSNDRRSTRERDRIDLAVEQQAIDLLHGL